MALARAAAAGTMTVFAAPLQNRRDVLGVGHLGRGRLLRLHRGRGTEACRHCGSQPDAKRPFPIERHPFLLMHQTLSPCGPWTDRGARMSGASGVPKHSTRNFAGNAKCRGMSREIFTAEWGNVRARGIQGSASNGGSGSGARERAPLIA